MNKNLTVILAVVAALAVISVGIVVAVQIVSNTVTVNPLPTPGLILQVDDTTPYVGNSITLTATLSVPSTGITVEFFAGATSIGSSTTTAGGVATKTYVVPSTAMFTVTAKAEIT